MTFFLVASGASLTIGIGLGCLFVTLRDAFKRDEDTAPRPRRGRESGVGSVGGTMTTGKGAAPRALQDGHHETTR